MESNKCPICDKTGIPDFINEDVVCPCCNSDLRIYRKIHLSSTNTNGGKTSKWPVVFVLLLMIILAIVGWRYTKISDFQKQISCMKIQLVEKDALIVQLLDSIKDLSQPIVKSNLENSHWYVVKPGDSFCKISRIVYGTENKYKTIIKLNNLKSNTILQPGDSIRIK